MGKGLHFFFPERKWGGRGMQGWLCGVISEDFRAHRLFSVFCCIVLDDQDRLQMAQAMTPNKAGVWSVDSGVGRYREWWFPGLQQEKRKRNPWSVGVCDERPCHYTDGEIEAPTEMHFPKVTWKSHLDTPLIPESSPGLTYQSQDSWSFYWILSSFWAPWEVPSTRQS